MKGFTVILEANIRDDDARPIAEAISQFRGVVSVVPILQEPGDMIVRQQVTNELAMKLYKALRE